MGEGDVAGSPSGSFDRLRWARFAMCARLALVGLVGAGEGDSPAGSDDSPRSKPRMPIGLGEGWFRRSVDTLEGPVLGDACSSDRIESGEGEDSSDRNSVFVHEVDAALMSRTMDSEPILPNGSGEGWS